MIFWGTQKGGFHIDEMFSLMEIRGGGLGIPLVDEGFFGVWHYAQDLRYTVGVNRENAFTYNSPNIRLLHPYYILLHTAYSFAPDVFSIWPGIILNILLYIGTIIILFLLGKMLITNKYLALLPSFIWGVSSAAIDTVVLLRMYSLFTFFCVLFTYVVIKTITKDPPRFVDWAILVIVSVMGFLSHPYFPIYAFFTSVFVGVYLLVIKRIKDALKFSASMLCTLVLYDLSLRLQGSSLLMFFAGYRQTEAIENLVNRNFIFSERVTQYSEILSRSVFANIAMSVVIVVAVLIIAVLFLTRDKKNKIQETIMKNENLFWIILCLVCTFYFLLILRIAPFITFRYISNITPLVMLLFIVLLIRLLSRFIENTKVKFSIILISCTMLLLTNISVPNLYRGAIRHAELLEPYYDVPVIVTVNSERDWDLVSTYWHLFNFRNQILFTLDNEPDISNIEKKTLNNGLILIHSTWGQTESIDKVLERYLYTTGLSSAIHVDDSIRHTVFLLVP